MSRIVRGFEKNSGRYETNAAKERRDLYVSTIKTDSKQSLLRSVLEIHTEIAERRGGRPWVWLEGPRIHSDIESEEPSSDCLKPGVTWRNDYYLRALRSITIQLNERLR
jgi:hypothetical protein